MLLHIFSIFPSCHSSSTGNSSKASLTSLNSFAESAGMNVILEKQFANCLKDDDITNQENEVNKFINDIKTKLKG